MNESSPDRGRVVSAETWKRLKRHARDHLPATAEPAPAPEADSSESNGA